MNPLIPKPGTAYQWLPMEDPAITDRKGKRLRTLVADLDNVYFNIKSERHSYYQALLSLGDRRVAPAIEAAERNGGNWRAAVAETGVDADFYIFRDRSADTHPALGHHRRRHEVVVLPRRVRQGAARGVDAAAEARGREQEVPAGALGPYRRRRHGRRRRSRDAPACSSYASRIRSRIRFCAVLSTTGRSSAKTAALAVDASTSAPGT